MGQPDRWQQAVGRWLVLAGLGCGTAVTAVAPSGCQLQHSLPPPEAVCVEPCQSIPLCGRNHVYIFFIHSLDPLDCANLKGVRDHVQQLGFNKTYYGQLYHTRHFEREIRPIHCDDPDARFVLIGFSCGASMVHSIAQAVEPIPIDLLVYLSSNPLKSVPPDRPENVCRIVNIQTDSCLSFGQAVDGAENVRINKVGHYGSPTHPYTLERLARELAAVAATVPVVLPPEPATPPEEMPPTPRPLPRQADGPRDQWDFLKPVPNIGNRMPPADQ